MPKSSRDMYLALWVCIGGLSSTLIAGEPPSDAGTLRPDKAPQGFFQFIGAAFDIQTDVSQDYLNRLARQVSTAEYRMYDLFKISDGFLRGNDPKAKLGKYGISGDILSKSGFKPFIEIRVFKKYEDFANEYFDESDRLESLVNKTPVKKETPEQRAFRRLTEGVPGAYYMRIRDYDGKYTVRRIRAYLGSKTPEEVEADILHELGHLFLETYLFEFAGSPKKGQESEKRGTPAWIGEGVAQLFGINWASSHEAKKDKLRQGALIYEAIKAGDHYAFSDFVQVTNAHNLLAVAGDPLKSTINYAQSFSVTQFMVEVNWTKYLNFLDNCRAYNFRETQKNPKRISELYSIQAKAFEDAFGGTFAQAETEWKKHVLKTMENELKRNPGGYYWCGEYFIRRKDLAKAEERFKLAIEGAPTQGDGYVGMGRVALMKGDIEVGLKHLLKGAELSPKNEDAWYYLGIAQNRSGKSDEAIASLKKAVEIYPRFHQAQSELADSYFDAGKYKESMEAYDAAFQIESDPQYLFGKGRSAFFAKDYDEAQKCFAAYANIYTKDPQGHFWYGMAAWRLGQKDYALKKLEQACSLAPNHTLFKQGLDLCRKGQMLTFEREDAGKVPEKKAAGEKAPPEKNPSKVAETD